LLVNATGPPQFGAVDREDPIVRLKVAKVGLLSRKGESMIREYGYLCASTHASMSARPTRRPA
jgi:hypothetical protein